MDISELQSPVCKMGDCACLEAVCLSSDCPNRISWRRWLKKTFISHSLEAEKSRVKVLAPLGPGESPLLGLQTATFSLCSGLLRSDKDTTPITRALPS